MTKFTLSKPVEHNGKEYADLEFREPEVGDLMAAGHFKDELSQNIAILAAISDVPMPAFKKIKARDLTGIMAATAELLGNGTAATIGS